MKDKKLFLASFLLISIIAVFAIIGYFQSIEQKDKGSARLVINIFNKSETKAYSFEDMSALELLKLDNEVNTTYSKFGAFVNCINRICSNSNYYWMYYVNSEMASVGASDYKLKNNDSIEFRYEKVS